MYINSAYLNNSLVDFKDKTKPLIVGSCGTYHLHTRPRLPTRRPRGRLDFQLLYIVSGKAYFYFDKQEEATIVTAGQMVIYRPREICVLRGGSDRGLLGSFYGKQCQEYPALVWDYE